MDPNAYDLIVTIVPKGGAERLLRASRDAGAEGGTILYGRGAGIHETRKVLGIPIEPEKEILLTAVRQANTQVVLASIVEAGRLDEPGTGVAFVLGIKEIEGVVHRGLTLHSHPDGP